MVPFVRRALGCAENTAAMKRVLFFFFFFCQKVAIFRSAVGREIECIVSLAAAETEGGERRSERQCESYCSSEKGVLHIDIRGLDCANSDFDERGFNALMRVQVV